MESVKNAKLYDIFSNPADGAQRRYTWSRPDGSIRSRVDFLFVSRAFTIRSTDVKPVFFSDHCLLLADCHLQEDQRVGRGTWKLNVQLLTPENIEELKRDYKGSITVKPLFESLTHWWEAIKENIKRFSILKGIQKARKEQREMSRLQKNMQNLLWLQLMGVDVKEELHKVKSQQASLYASEASKVIFRFIVRSVEQDEMCSRFFFQKVHTESSVISSLKEEDGSVKSSQSDILRISESFPAGLYVVKPTDSTASLSFLSSIIEVLDDSTRERLDKC
ncbi:uncharacterized protein LOC144691177 [Cetorhinus maximus]